MSVQPFVKVAPTVKVALAQINAMVGDMPGNAVRIVEAARRAYEQGARLVLTPELGLCGYPPEDLLLRPAFMQACAEALAQCAEALADLPGLFVVVGHPHQFGDRGDVRSNSVSVPQRYNAASVLGDGRVLATYCKRELPNYQVFDERRYFASGRDAGLPPLVFEVDGLKFGLVICEDAWFDEPGRAAKAAGAEVLCVINASPFHLGKIVEREARMAATARSLEMPLLYAHMAGGQDEVVFDGASFALDASGAVTARAPMFDEALAIVEVSAATARGEIAPELSIEAQAWKALVVGVRDYVNKNGFPGVIIGLSGGIDSALVLAIAVDALGADRVRTVMMPSPYTADISWIDARDMAERLHVRYDEISIVPMFEDFKKSLAAEFAGRAEDATEENIQARIRGILLMALSNKFGSIVLTTGNKSEMATGYCTLYGDMAGGFAVIKDVRQDAGLPARGVAQRAGRRSDSRTHHHAPAVRRASTRPEGPGQPAALRGARRHPAALHGRRPGHRRDRRRRFPAGRRRARHAADQDQRIQAPAVAGRHPDHAPGLRPRLEIPHHLEVPRLN